MRNRGDEAGQGRRQGPRDSAFRAPRSALVLPAPARDGLRALALFLAFAGFYLLTASGHFYTVDEETFYLMTESLVERHTLALPADAWGIVGQFGQVVDPTQASGPVYAIFTPGQPVAAVPLYLLGRAVAALFPPEAHGYVTRFFVATFGSFVTAATVAVLYLLTRALGYRGRVALGLAAIYGLATSAWPHGRTFLAEPLTALLLLACFYAIVRGTERLRIADCGLRIGTEESGTAGGKPPRDSAIRNPQSAFVWLILSGATAAAAVTTKPHAVIALPFLGLYLLWGAARVPEADAAGRGDRRGWARIARAALAWGAGGALVAAPYVAFSLAMTGAPLGTRYGSWPLELFNNPFLTGLYGLTVSSGKGLLWYSPPVIAAIVSWWPFARRHRAEALVCLGIVLAHVAFYAKLRFWHGDWIWGPRFLTIALPFAVLPLADGLDRLRGRRVFAGLVAVTVAAGVAVSLLGVLVNLAWYIVRSDDQQARFFSPPASPIVVHARYLAQRAGEWRAHAFPPPDTALLTGGFFPTESDHAHDLFPRWTDGAGEVTLYPAARAPLVVKLTFFDHRPAGLRQGQPTVLVDGAPLPEGAVERRDFTGTGEGWVYQLTVPAEAIHRGQATVTLRSPTWNPMLIGQDERDQDLGVFVHSVEVWRDGRPFHIGRAREIEPMPAATRARHWWFDDDRAADGASVDAPAHHLTDNWAWYAAVAGFDRRLTTTWIASYAATAAALFLAGVGVFLRTLSAGALRRAARPGRRARGRARARGRGPALPRSAR